MLTASKKLRGCIRFWQGSKTCHFMCWRRLSILAERESNFSFSSRIRHPWKVSKWAVGKEIRVMIRNITLTLPQ